MLSSGSSHSDDFSADTDRAARAKRRRRMASPALFLAGLAGLSTIASACGSDAGANAAADDASPLEALFGWGSYDEVEGRRQELEMQQQIVVCMKDEGFEYIAVDWAAQAPAPITEDADLEWGSDEFGAKYGYGVMHNYETWEADQIAANNTGNGIADDYVDPNSDYLMTLSESEQNAYNEALYGKQDQYDQTDENGEYIQPPLESQGCQGKAQLATYGQDIWSTPGFSSAFEDMGKRQESDPALINANADWKDCATDTITMLTGTADLPDGMSINRPEDLYQAFDAMKAIATGQQILPIDPETGEPIGEFDDTGGYSSTQNADGTGYAMVGTQTLIPAARIEELQALEIDVWKKDQKCQDDVGIEAIRRDLEQQMADELIAKFPQLAEKADKASATDTSEVPGS